MAKRSRLWLIGILIAAFMLASCQQRSQEAGDQGTETPGTESTKAGKGSRRARASKESAEQATVEKLTVPAGTPLSIRLTDGIDTGKTPEGASFEGALAEALTVGGIEVAPTGSKVAGKVTHVVSSGRLNRPAELSLILTSLTPEGGKQLEISTNTWSVKGESHKKRNLEMIGGGGGVGAIIGAIAGGKKGAAIGGAVGAGAGTGVAAYTGKKEIVLAPESRLNFELAAPVTVTVTKK
ncbi:MAG TPA: hypothetical protein VFD30_01950 [Terriglobia bacterium]|nr:hypothetical protein [Terriglobia bacterium]